MHFAKKNYWFALTFICCIPLFFVNIKSSHEWGDDFAHYIHQAQNVVEGISQQQTGYIFNERFAVLGPPVCMMGFPLLLAPVYYFFGLDFIAFSYFISCFFALMLLLIFSFLKNYIKDWQAFLLILILAINPWILNFKKEIISDVPFTCFLLLAFLLYAKAKTNFLTVVLLGLIAGYLISIRMVGISFSIAIALNELRLAFTEKIFLKNKRLLFFGIVVPVIALCFHYTLNYLLFDLPKNSATVPLSIFSIKKLYGTIIFNTYYYLQVYQDLFFGNWENTNAFAPTLLKSFFLCFTLIGFYLRTKNNFSVNEIFCIVYIFILLCYNYTGGGFRYLLPVLPFALIYFSYALVFFITHAGVSKKIFVICAIALIGIAYKYEWQKIYTERNYIIEGPMRIQSVELIQHICESTKPTDHLIFVKPRALALFTGRHFFCTHPDESSEIILQQIKEHHISYIITFDKLPNNGLLKFMESNTTNVELTWKNDLFKFYKIKL